MVNQASRAVVRLICLLALVFPRFSVGQDFYELIPGALIENSVSGGNIGSAAAVNSAGDRFLLVNPLGQVIIAGREGSRNGEFSVENAAGATDIASDGGLGAFVCNPYFREIAHINRTGEILPSLSIKSEAPIEPISLAALRDGRVFLLNARDGDIWRIERDGTAYPLLITSGARIDGVARLEISPDESKLILLNKDKLRYFRLNGESLPAPKVTVSNPQGIAAVAGGVWVIGSGLEFIPFSATFDRLIYPADSLRAWQIFPPVDIAATADELLILTDNNAKTLELKLVRRQH